MCHADAKQAMQKLDGLVAFRGPIHRGKRVRSDSKVMERALDRALQEAEKRGVNALEVIEVTLH